MNYYEHHLGDYLRDTAHLTMLEDGAYRRLLDAYYIKEAPLPLQIKDVCRLARANQKLERQAVETVLNEFFEKTEDGWRHKRCDEELARYRAGEPEREAKRANEESRVRRHREERAALFQKLSEAGIHPEWNTGIRALREMAAALPDPLQIAGPVTPPVTAPVTPATASMNPDTRLHTQIKNTADTRARELLTSEMVKELLHAAGEALMTPPSQGLLSFARPCAWIETGASWGLDVLPAVAAAAARAKPKSIRTWSYFDAAVADAQASRNRPMPEGNSHERTHSRRSDRVSSELAALASASGIHGDG